MIEKRKKVLVFSHELPPIGGGAGVVASQHCLELAALGYDVTLLTKNQIAYPKELSNIEIIGVPYIPKVFLFPYCFKLKNIDLDKFEHIILNDIVSVYIAGACFAIKDLQKSISFLHGNEIDDIYQKQSFYFKIIGFKYFYNNAILNVKKIIAVSKFMKNKFLLGSSLKQIAKISVHYSKLGPDFFPIKISKKQNKKSKPNEIILSVSRIEKGKGFVEMYNIFKKLISLDSTFIWIIVGDGSFKKTFEDMVQNDGLEKHIKFIGKIDRGELKGYFESADIFWLLSNYQESFGLVYLEAQSCLCPAIGYNKFGVVEAISDTKTGFLVNNKEECLDIFLQRKYKDLNKSDFYLFVNQLHSSSLKTIF